jgi:hypothetical protein
MEETEAAIENSGGDGERMEKTVEAIEKGVP